jgi:hypothetical protein
MEENSFLCLFFKKSQESTLYPCPEETGFYGALR